MIVGTHSIMHHHSDDNKPKIFSKHFRDKAQISHSVVLCFFSHQDLVLTVSSWCFWAAHTCALEYEKLNSVWWAFGCGLFWSGCGIFHVPCVSNLCSCFQWVQIGCRSFLVCLLNAYTHHLLFSNSKHAFPHMGPNKSWQISTFRWCQYLLCSHWLENWTSWICKDLTVDWSHCLFALVYKQNMI